MAASKRRSRPRHASDRSCPISDPILLRFREERGLLTRIARELGINPQAVHQWRLVPLERVLEVEAITGVPREILRPDFHRNTLRKTTVH
jgi:hypothetical protein